MLPPLGVWLALGSLIQGCLCTCIPHTTPCSSLKVTPPEGASLMNATATERYNVTYDGPTYNGVAGSVNICDVEVFLTHGDARDAVRITIYLPLEGWNGRWQGTGGGGFAAGQFDFELVPAVTSGYSAGATDAGVGLDGNTDVWYNSTQLVKNFVYLSLHEMTVIGKDLSEKFYGKKPEYSYWFGCSTGGRQGMSEAQRYPEDYDGIFAGAPAINWDRFVLADYWPVAAQKQEGDPVPLCKFNAITNASVKACDLLDGATDGLISNPLKCKFDAKTLVDVEVQCDGNATTTITENDAVVWSNIRNGLEDSEGNSLWYGLEPGTDYKNLAELPGFLISRQWIADFLLDSPGLDLSNIKQDELVDLFHQSVSEFGDLWATDNPDLSAFSERGGKILTWHGWADDLIPPVGTIDYWQRVVDLAGGEKETDEFYRVFMAPGLGHCGGGPGPQMPVDNLAPLVDWVEKGKAPETILFSGNGQSRNICKFPKELEYIGSGDVSDAASWKCV
ncbi:tannase and feruloyl esterase [Hypomontagnella monticulosa]|nr:tannase and feruloyl esterase [Hypomontagnella monticulosa]